YLKPTKACPDNHPRAANEKIVADLAVELNIAVPPTCLFRVPNCPAGVESRACISLTLGPEFWEWSHLKELDTVANGLGHRLARAALSPYSGGIALDALIGNTDRNNERNAMFVADRVPGYALSFFYLDHANSLNMGDRWQNDGWRPTAVP